MRFVAHIPIGQYDLPIPLLQVVIAAVIVVGGSFALIYLVPERPRPQRAPREPLYVPETVTWELRAIAAGYVVFLIVVTMFGRQGLAALNAGALLFWVFTIPLLPLLHCIIGGVYAVANPFAAAAGFLSGGRRLVDADRVLDRLGYWPSVVLLFLIVEGESITEVVQNPAILGYAVVLYSALQIAAGMLFGRRWYRGGDVFQAITNLASSIAPLALRRDKQGYLRLLVGFSPRRLVADGAGRNALVTLWLAGVLADGIRALPVWRLTIAPALEPAFARMGTFAGVNIGAAAEITTEVIVTWIAFGVFFWLFVTVASAMSAPRGQGSLSGARLRRFASVVAPSLIPITVAYLLAHNMSQLLVAGPLIVSARDASASQVTVLTNAQIATVTPYVGVVWWVQAGAIVLGHVVAVLMAHARIGDLFAQGWGGVRSLATAADLGWLSAMLLYTATSLWILAQPITVSH